MIDPKILQQSSLSLEELLVFILVSKNVNFSQTLNQLIDYGLVYKTEPVIRYQLTEQGETHIAYLNSLTDQGDQRLIALAIKLREIYPKGKKEGTTFYWAESPILIVKRLRTFFQRYGNFNDEDIIDSTQQYVNSFNGQYKLMQLLKYFIFKDKRNAGVVEYESQLLNYLGNRHEENTYDDWISNLN